MQSLKILRRAATLAVFVSLIVVMLGAYTRLTHAGLGCPDWPGCYGRMAVSSLQHELSDAQARFPDTPIESRKAWTEMIHRYIAGSLVLLVLFINIAVARANRLKHHVPRGIPLFVMGLIIFQALLGMWTVTLKLLPLVVMGHLLGGILIFSSLCYFRAQLSQLERVDNSQSRFWINAGILLVFCQIALGGWVSSNYAGIACIGFPQCNGQWLPTLHFSEAFQLISPIGTNYQGGVLDSDARVTIQFVHRIGAFIVALYLLGLSVVLAQNKSAPMLRRAGLCIALVVLVQFSLGIANVVYMLPLAVAVLHNGIAALLLALMLVTRYLVSKEARYGHSF